MSMRNVKGRRSRKSTRLYVVMMVKVRAI